jgi:trk system potassium uptake protein
MSDRTPSQRWRVGERRVGPVDRFRHPGRVVAGGFALAVMVGTALLSLPGATKSGERASFVDALFTSTSAVCVNGLVVVDTGGYWSTYGQVVILVLMQAGGLGIMSMATLATLLISRRMGVRARLFAQAETQAVRLSDVRRVVRNVVVFSAVTEFVVAVILTLRFAITYDMPVDTAIYHGIFHSVSAFNNAGFSLNADSLVRFIGDPWVTGTIAAAFIIGGLGFPVVFELLRSWRRPGTWSVLTWLTIGVSSVLLVLGTVVLTLSEYSNPHTLGPLSGADKVLAGFFASATPRSAGFNNMDVSQMTSESWLLTDILMFIGGGSASTAGGIKVTTFGLLAFVIWAELRGDTQVNVRYRRIPEGTQRQAVAIGLIGVGLVAVSTFVLLGLASHDLDRILFETISAVCTVGLSTGITAELPDSAQVLLVILMFVGRIGPLTLGSALALRDRTRRYELPEERPIVG